MVELDQLTSLSSLVNSTRVTIQNALVHLDDGRIVTTAKRLEDAQGKLIELAAALQSLKQQNTPPST
jgi:ABC-type enterochelin transport system ATPase subunit